jgi:predicted AlkP superfamily pyrophosphatase or phosphodiesterase
MSGLKRLFFPGWIILHLILCFILCFSCAGSPGENDNPKEQVLPARHVVFIGLDGWGADFVSKADMPTVKRMIAGGASTLECWNVLPTSSWPNWSSLFSGAPPEELRSQDNFPSIFSLLKEKSPAATAVFFYEWSKLKDICTAESADMKGDIQSDAESARAVAAYIKEKNPTLTVVVFNEPDSTGHSKRWGSAAYYAKLAELDALIALIENGVKDAGLYDTTVFVLSADHGGILWGHGFNTPGQRRIPLIIYGSAIREGFVIPSPVSICDIAPTMAAMLGLEAPPEWTGKSLQELYK